MRKVIGGYLVTEHLKAADQHEQHDDREQLAEIGEKQADALRERLEKAEQEHHERQAEKDIVKEARDLAHTHEDVGVADIPAERRRGPITKKQLSHGFDSQMHQARAHMTPASRAFSKVIHSRPVETASDIASSTIARPNALLYGSICAFIAVTVLYFVAKYYGFRLSGFEAIGAFIFGWVVGILYDYFSVMIRGKDR